MVDFYGINVYLVLILSVWLNDWRIQTLHYDCCSAKAFSKNGQGRSIVTNLLLDTLPETNSSPLKIDENRPFRKEISSSNHPFSGATLVPTSLGNPYRIKGNPPNESVPSSPPWIFHGHFWVVNNHKNPMPPTDDAMIGGKCRFRWFFWCTETKKWTCWFLQDCTQRGTTQTHFLRTETKQILLRQGNTQTMIIEYSNINTTFYHRWRIGRK